MLSKKCCIILEVFLYTFVFFMQWSAEVFHRELSKYLHSLHSVRMTNMPLPVSVLPDAAIAGIEILEVCDSVGNFLARLYVIYNALSESYPCATHFVLFLLPENLINFRVGSLLLFEGRVGFTLMSAVEAYERYNSVKPVLCVLPL